MNFEGVVMNNMNQKMIDAVIDLLKCGINTASKDYNMIVE